MTSIVASDVRIEFPYNPYPCQVGYMDKVVQSLQTGNNAILESPTGTGKTLCLLCASLAWLVNKKAQISNIKYQANNAEQEPLRGIFNNHDSDNRIESAKLLDSAAGSWNKELGTPKIIYASRTHSQLNQAMQEFKKTKYKHLKACVIGSREQLCIHPQVSKETNNATKVHMCRAKVIKRACHYSNNVEAFKTRLINEILDIEDLVGLGQKHSVCPYFLTKEMKKDADIIFMPYNYLLDPKSRKAQGVELQGNILIFDEAHNLERICEESASFDFSSTDLASAISDTNRIVQKVQEWTSSEFSSSVDSDSPSVLDFSMEDVLTFKGCLLKLEEKIDSMKISGDGETYPGEKIFEILSEVGLTLATKNQFLDLTDKMVNTLTNDVTNSVFTSKGGGLSKFSDMMQVVFTREPSERMNFKSYIDSVSKHYKVHLKEEQTRIRKKVDSWSDNVQSHKNGRVLSYWCFNPGYTMADLKSNGAKVIILTSGTMSPLESFISEFGMDFPVRLENTHVIDKKQVSIGSLGISPDMKLLSSAYENRFKTEYMEGLGYTIANFAKAIPKGVLVFFPSYSLMEKSLDHWKSTGIKDRLESIKPVFVEPKTKTDFTLAMLGFYEKIKSSAGAIFMAVCRGKVSEGLDFADDNGRGVIITGLPYPPMMDARVRLKMQFLDEMKRSSTDLSGREWYNQQASRAVNQAIGRVIRHRNDFGVILLCDERFSKLGGQLPLWLRSEMQVYNNFGAAQLAVKKFFKNFDVEAPTIAPIKREIDTFSTSKKNFSNNKNSKTFSDGGGFELTGFKSNNKIMKASTVINHYGSVFNSDDYPVNIFEEYGRPGKSIPQSFEPKKGLLSALENAEDRSASTKQKQSEDNLQASNRRSVFSNPGSNARPPNQEELKVISNSFLQYVKSVINEETYKQFRGALQNYKAKNDVNSLLTDLERILDILDPKNVNIFVGLCRLIRPADQETFKELCSSVIGPPFDEAIALQSSSSSSSSSLPSTVQSLSKTVQSSSTNIVTASSNTILSSSSSSSSLPPVKKEDQKVSAPPNKRQKIENCTDKPVSQTLMNHFFKKSSPQLSNLQDKQNLDCKTHLQSNQHMSSSGMKLQPKTGSSSLQKPKNFKGSSTDNGNGGLVIKQKTCPVCDIVHDGPLARSSLCGHSCCRMCWQKSLSTTKMCPICGIKLKRSSIQIGYFLP